MLNETPGSATITSRIQPMTPRGGDKTTQSYAYKIDNRMNEKHMDQLRLPQAR